ncbi:MAG: 4Fe-4S binding protein, partial [Lentisphaeria bacterium]|nr:4Fe-4S binding protein [Lentisphaeria bacterium]
HLIAPEIGPFVRMAFIITDAPLEVDAPFGETLCDKCGKCISACPGNAVSESGTDSWQCAVYYRGAHKSNPFMDGEFLNDDPERENIISGNKHFSREDARKFTKR